MPADAENNRSNLAIFPQSAHLKSAVPPLNVGCGVDAAAHQRAEDLHYHACMCEKKADDMSINL